MNRTIAIFIGAGILALLAVLLAREPRSAPPPPKVPGTKITGGVGLYTNPSQTHLLRGGQGEVFLEVGLKAPEVKKIERLPLNLALVIDRSGSMAGQKLQNAREAAAKLVQRLRQKDRISIITYGSDVTVLVHSTVITQETRSEIREAISTITDRGGTFLSGGLERGREEVLKHSREGYINRVMLISDGQANEGITTPQDLSSLARQTLSMGVNLTTMGVGLDFNEKVMTAMAEHGGGHYYFIQDSTSMARLFEEELDKMASVVGKSATLHLELEPKVELLQLYGYPIEREGHRITVPIPDLFGGQRRKIMCKFRVPARREGKVALGRFTLTYTAVDGGEKKTLLGEAEVFITADKDKVALGQNKDVMAKAHTVQAAQTIDRAMKAYESGDVHRSKRLLRNQIDQIKSANTHLGSRDLDDLAATMDKQLEATKARPSSVAGRRLRKKARYKAYQQYH